MTRWFTALLFVACGAPAAPAAPPQPPQSTAPTACCASFDEIRTLDGRRVALVGTYEPTAVRKGKPRAEDDAKARTVAIHSGDVSVMLEVYYAPLGTRPDDEIARFAHKRVRVVGTMHARTPERIVDGEGPLQTMIGPCVTDIETIDEAL